jgi:hypothetical protein
MISGCRGGTVPVRLEGAWEQQWFSAGRSQRDELSETYGEEGGGGETSPTRK